MTGADVVVLHQVFRSVLAAMATPGRSVALPPGAGAGTRNAVAAVVASAWEPSAAIALHGTAELPPPYGTSVVALADAELVVCAGDAAGALREARRGSEAEPELGATVILVERSGGIGVTLSGPGVPRPFMVRLPLSAAELGARNQACATWPLGIDLLFVAAGSVTGLPRSTAAAAVSVSG